MSVATLLILKIYYRKYCSCSKSAGTRSLNIPAPNTEDLQALALETLSSPRKRISASAQSNEANYLNDSKATT